eukprot:CAMPEP_0173378382 /NCGR_PEP_ID=MMETSP1356-20130122/1547_1 /TAXON_ID=77927 ORGANISM="Hemiselmis virescens, Strain PCC157" /NCGR_SAMPLE_ID=MMETSP1356 /ASSEMBLY_ACC=CAM_ASM_000847 /LENGTH=401 /DNA_ID=CAMNT_0014331425 /DNA_START=176 /DNA_END=1377 /DNA_ORIENTATION=+
MKSHRALSLLLRRAATRPRPDRAPPRAVSAAFGGVGYAAKHVQQQLQHPPHRRVPTPAPSRRMCSGAAGEGPITACTMMTDDERSMRDSVEIFAREVLAPKVGKMDAEAAMDPEVIAACFEAGIMAIEAPEEYGGVGLGFTASCLAVEEIARVDPAFAVMIDIQNTLLITSFMRYGTTAQKEKFLTRLCKDTVCSFCLSEAGSGSDAFSLKTRAEYDKATNEYVITGTKCWISNSHEAGLFVVFANADPAKGHKGITAFIVDRTCPGLTVGPKEAKLGIRASSTCEVSLEGCRVPAENVLGEVGQGYRMAIELLNEGRIGIGAQMVGLARGAFDAAMPYIHQRKQFGTAIADFQGMQFQYARAAMEIESARVMVYNAARLKEAGQPFVAEAAMAKLKATEV